MLSSGAKPHPVGQGEKTWIYAKPRLEHSRPRFILPTKSIMWLGLAVAQYSILCMARMSGTYLAFCSLPFIALPVGVVEVREPRLVVEERWKPVFI